jgi:cytoskeletal protein CcmA (bactofilin family)
LQGERHVWGKDVKRAAAATPISTLIGADMTIRGDIEFRGGLRVDGTVIGNVHSEAGQESLLVISERARIQGEVRVAHLLVNGTIEGPVQSDVRVELEPKGRIVGDLRYSALEMHHGAVIEGALAPLAQDAAPGLKLLTRTE